VDFDADPSRAPGEPEGPDPAEEPAGGGAAASQRGGWEAPLVATHGTARGDGGGNRLASQPARACALRERRLCRVVPVAVPCRAARHRRQDVRYARPRVCAPPHAPLPGARAGRTAIAPL